MKKILVSSLLFASLLVACGSDPIVTEMDILSAKNSQTLPKLYQRLLDDQKIAKPSSEWAESIHINLGKVGKEIALEKEQKILANLQTEKAIYDPAALMKQHDIATLQQALKRSADIEKYNKEVYFGLARQFEQVINDKKVEVRVRQANFSSMSDREAVKKVALLDEISEISGGDVAAETELQKTAYIDGLFAQAESALKNKRHEDVLMHLNNLEKIDPSYPNLEQLRNSLNAEEYEQQFWDALGDGDTDKAYELFYKLSQIPIYMEKNHSIKPIAEDIAQYFLVAGKSSLAKFKMPEAYEAYSRARYIRNVLDQADKYDDGEKAFIKQLEDKITYFVENDKTLQAYGYLSVLEEMKPDHALLSELASKVNNKVYNDAVIKVLQESVTDKGDEHKFASFLSVALKAEVEKILPSRVQLLAAEDKEKYSSNRVKELDNAAGFYRFTGEILDMNLDLSSVQESEIKNVLVTHRRIENPEYLTWQSLSKRQKKATTEPEPTIMKPVLQDVEIIHVIKQKKAEASLSYRVNVLVDHAVMVSDALSEVVDYSVKTNEAVLQGDFSQAAIEKTLPSDEKVLAELSQLMAEKMVKKLSTAIVDMEDKYTDKAQSAFVAKNYSVAAANFSYRNAIYQAQGKSDVDVLKGLRISAMNWQ